MKLGEYLNTQNISRAEMAKRLGVSVEAVRQWSVGERAPRPQMQSKIMDETAGQVTPMDFHQTRVEWLEARQ